jgi:hypothetical protein
MTTRWETPGFETLMVAGECTAYSGALAAGSRPVVRAGMVGASARPANPPLGGPQAEAPAPAVH